MAEAALQRGAEPRRLVLYDGVCGFCDSLVRWLLARDGGRFLYAPLQGRTAAELRGRHPQIPGDPDTLVYVERVDGRERVYLRSDAVLEMLARLGPPWRWIARLRGLPRWLRDPGYRLFARWRYRLFGRLDACRVPDAGQRARFLD